MIRRPSVHVDRQRAPFISPVDDMWTTDHRASTRKRRVEQRCEDSGVGVSRSCCRVDAGQVRLGVGTHLDGPCYALANECL